MKYILIQNDIYDCFDINQLIIIIAKLYTILV